MALLRKEIASATYLVSSANTTLSGNGIGNRAPNNSGGTEVVEIDAMIQQLNRSGQDVFWQGRTSQESIQRLESLLGSPLPVSFKRFLTKYGGGGVVGEEISGIEDDNAGLEHRGTVYGDTLNCREIYDIPEVLIVIYLGGDDVVWCLDVSQLLGDECPVVSFDVFSRKVKPIAPNFNDFLEGYLKLRISRHEPS